MASSKSLGRRKLAVIAAWSGIVASGVLAIVLVLGLVRMIQTSEKVGVGICVPLGGMLAIVVGMLGPWGWSKLAGLWRRSKRVFRPGPQHVEYDPRREIAAHEPWLGRLMQDTRSVLHDMNHLAGESEWWPSDDLHDGWFARLRRRVAPGATDGFVGFAVVNRITRDVWDWLRTIEALPPDRRSYLEDRGVDAARLREVLLAEGDFHWRFQSMVRLLRGFEDGLFASASDPFRGVRPLQDSRPSTPPLEGSDAIGCRAPDDAATEEASRRRSYAELIDEQGPALRSLAARYARTPEDREDLYQDMTLAIWKALPRFRGESSLTTYVLRVARNTGIDHLRIHRVTVAEVETEDRSASPEEQVGWALVGARLQRAVGELPKMLREVFELHLEGHGYQEIARRTGLSEGNVGARLTRARHRLRRRLGRLGRLESPLDAV